MGTHIPAYACWEIYGPLPSCREAFPLQNWETLVSNSALSAFEYGFVLRKKSPGKSEQVSAGWELSAVLQTLLPSPGADFG